LLASDSHAQLVAKLGDEADALATAEVIAPPSEAVRRCVAVVQDSPLASLAPDRLVELAASASRKAALSARLEIYPKDMPARRALDLCAAVLRGLLTEEELIGLVRARYPKAEPLPPRPALDALLGPLGLTWNEADSKFGRPGERSASSLHTRFTSHTALTAPRGLAGVRQLDEQVVAADDFDDRVRATLDSQRLRIVGVTADKAEAGALALRARLKVPIVELDRELVAAMHGLMAKEGIAQTLVHEADLSGPSGAAWGNLRKLAEQAAAQLVAKWFPARQPMLLTQPGLIARYRLEGFLSDIVEAARRDDSAAVFLLVPSADTGGIPRISGELIIPGVRRAESVWMPTAWVKRHAPKLPT
jgi:hypothetical protein